MTEEHSTPIEGVEIPNLSEDLNQSVSEPLSGNSVPLAGMAEGLHTRLDGEPVESTAFSEKIDNLRDLPSSQQPKPDESIEPSPEEVLSMASYLGIDLGKGESNLLSVAKEAVTAPVLPPWEEKEDDQGHPFFYNHRTKESSRRHPLDCKFLELVGQMRQDLSTPSERTWMKFSRPEKTPYYYNFKDGTSAESLPEGGQEILPIPIEKLPTFNANTLGINMDVPGGVPSIRPVVRPDLVNRDGVVKVLVFKSWWAEDREEEDYGDNQRAGGGLKRRYLTIKFDIYAQTFELKLDNEEVISLYNLSSVVAKEGQAGIQCWDLHVGAKLNLLGKTTTLMQGDLDTLNWLDKHAKRLRGIKAAILKDLKKYETRALAAAVTFEKGPNTRGGTSLRALMDQIDRLCATLGQFRPSLAAKYAKQATQPP